MALGMTLAVAGVIVAWRSKPSERRILIPDACRTPARVLQPAPGAAAGAVVVFHGLSASAAVMEPIGQSFAAAGWRVYLLDLPGHGRSSERFSYAGAESCAAAAVDWLARTGAIERGETVLLGHSLGGAVAVRLAERFPAAATIAISPALLALPRRAPPNLLVLTAQFDFTPVKRRAAELVALAGGARQSADDFLDRRAVELRRVSGATHGGMILDPRVWKLAVDWSGRARAATPGAAAARLSQPAPLAAKNPIAAPAAALLATLAFLAGLVLLVAPVETLLARICGMKPVITQPAGIAWKTAVGYWTLGSFLAVSSLGLTRAAQWLRPVWLDGGDWAALVALVTGVVLLALSRRREAFRAQPWELLFAALAGIAILVIFAVALNPELVELADSPARLWRFFVLVPFTWPYFAAEEMILGAPRGWKRLVLFLALRAVVWLAQAFAVLVFWRWGLLMILLVLEFLIVSVGQRLAADALRRRGADVPAAALFDAILAAGMLASVLPLT